MAIQSITKPMALDETLQSTNTALGGVAKDTTLQSTNGKMDFVITKLQGIIDALGIKTSVYKAGGDKTCAELVPALLIEDYCGYVYNITDTGTTTSDFVEGAGKPINIGDNVGIVDRGTGGNHVYKFDLMAGMVDLTDYIKKSSTSGFVKNDGTIDTTTYQPTEAGKGLSSNDYTSAEKTKLANIATGATKTESSETNGNIKIDGTETQVYNDAEIQGKLSTDTTQATGNPINFTTKTAQNAVSTIIDLEPIQDLHGYDKPWTGGAGKNKLLNTVDDIKSANPSGGTWSGNTFTLNNVVFTVLTDSDGNVIGIKANGIANADTSIFIVSRSVGTSFSLATGTYILSGCPANGSSNTYMMQFQATREGSIYQYGVDYGEGASGEVLSTDRLQVTCRIKSGYNAQNIIFYPMIRLSTETDPTFAPYTNLCPISGRTEIGILGCGKNLLPLVLADIKSVNTEGTWSGNAYTYGNVTYTVNIDSDGNVIGIKANGTASGTSIFITPSVVLIGNYIINGCPSGGANNTYRLDLRDANDSVIVEEYGNEQSVTLETSKTVHGLIRIQSGYNVQNKEFKPMLRLSTETDDTFEPYTKSNDLTISLGETVYGCHYSLESGELRVEEVIKTLNQLTWTYSSEAKWFYSNALTDAKAPSGSDVPANAIFSAYKNTSRDYMYNNPTVDGLGAINSAQLVLIRDLAYTDTTNFINARGSQQICYELATPTTIQLTPHQISLLKGVNNISVSDDYSEITLTYRSGAVATLGDLLDTENKMLAKQHVYSTDEQVVGTWIDGSPIYEKTYDLGADTAISYTSWTEIDANYPTNCQLLIHVDAFTSGGTYASGISVGRKANGKFEMQSGRNGYDQSVRYFVIQYTKST